MPQLGLYVESRPDRACGMGDSQDSAQGRVASYPLKHADAAQRHGWQGRFRTAARDACPRRTQNDSSAIRRKEPDMENAGNQIVVYQPNETIRLDVRLENDTVWLNRQQMAQLFGRDVKTIGKHIANALKEELSGCPQLLEIAPDQNQVVAKFATTALDGKTYQVEYYSLDMILSVGYRVKSIQGVAFRRWANTVLKEYLLRGYAVNARMNQLEDKMDRRLSLHDNRIAVLERKVDFFVQTKEPPLQGIFYQNRFWDAKSLLVRLIRRARKELMVIDAYPGPATLDILSKRGRGVAIELVTHSNRDLEESDFEAFGAQCGRFTKTLCGICHDRFIVIDRNELFWTGASLKDAGRLVFAVARMGAELIPGLVAAIRNAASESVAYPTAKKKGA